MLQTILARCESEFAQHGKIEPRLYCHRHGAEEMIDTSLSGATKRDIGAAMTLIAAHGDCVAMVGEAWLVEFTSKDRPALAAALESGEDALLLAPHDDPSRIETVMVNMHHRGNAFIRTAPILRPEGAAPRLGPWKIRDCNHKDVRKAPLDNDSDRL